MKRFIEGEDRSQSVLFPERLDDYIGDDNPARVIDAFVGELDLVLLGFECAEPEAMCRSGFGRSRNAYINSMRSKSRWPLHPMAK